MKNKKTMSIIGVAAGVCVLTSAAFANYQTANGYEALKQSVFNVPKYENYTMNMDFSLSADGNQLVSSTLFQEYDKASQKEYSRNESKTIEGSEYVNENWYYDGMNIWKNSDGSYDGIKDAAFGYSSFLPSTGDEESQQKLNKFLGLLADTIVGDLKNNFVCVEDGEESATYEVNLTSVQIPELINAGLGAVFSVQNYYYDNSEFYNENSLSESDQIVRDLGSDPRVDSASCRFTVSKDNMLQSLDMNIVFAGADKDGARHEMTANAAVDFSDVGTTSVRTLDLNTTDVNFLDDEIIIDTEAEETAEAVN